MRLRAKKDSNHNAIADAFTRLGWSWWDTHQLGNGFVDGVAGRPGINVLVEIKDGSKPPSKRKLTPDEIDFHKTWRGPILIIHSIDEIINFHNSCMRASA